MPISMQQLIQFPDLPGVYLMKNGRGEVLYVGKAIRLRQRIRQYFHEGQDGRVMVPFLVRQVEAIDTIVVQSEKEALLLENTLIKRYQPQYNALLKDDKSYICLQINIAHPWPMVRLVRAVGPAKKGVLQFGPYTSANAARQTLHLLQRLFPLRQCSDQELLNRTRPCILYDMKRCVAPCVAKCSAEEYQALVRRTIAFLRGHTRDVIQELYRTMQEASDALDFERAGQILTTLRAVEQTLEKQHVDHLFEGDYDVFGLFRELSEVAVCKLLIREGKVVGTKIYRFTGILQEDEEILSSLLLQETQGQEVEGSAKEILLPISLPDHVLLEEILSSQRKCTMHLSVPQKGVKKRWLELAEQNAKASYQQQRNEEQMREALLLEIEEQLNLTQYPRCIECIDHSHLGGQDPVSALVAFIEGKKESRRFRLYRLRTAASADDYGMLREVLERRFKRGKGEETLPELLLIDGGKGHLAIAHEVLSELDISTVDIIAISKEAGRHDRGMTQEQIHTLHSPFPIILPLRSPILFFLQRVRDEAHRVSIAFQRKRRSKRTIGSRIADIPGIGPIKQKRLLRHFGSLQKIKQATEEQLKEVKGIHQKDCENICAFFAREEKGEEKEEDKKRED